MTEHQAEIVKRAPATLEEVKALCDDLYNRDGFVKWAEVAEILGVSRQAIFNRLNASVAKGQLSEAEVERWRSSSSRRALTRKNKQLRREQEKLRISVTLTPDNKRWLAYNSKKEHCTTSDIINGLINKARSS
jgi:hypothetical protein